MTLMLRTRPARNAEASSGGSWLHALGEGNAKQAQPGRQHPQGRGAQEQPGAPGGLVVSLENGALLVERGEQAGRLEDVAAQPVRLGGVGDLLDDRAEAQQ